MDKNGLTALLFSFSFLFLFLIQISGNREHEKEYYEFSPILSKHQLAIEPQIVSFSWADVGPAVTQSMAIFLSVVIPLEYSPA